MATMHEHELNGFVYYCKHGAGSWNSNWYFRPEGAALSVNCVVGRKAVRRDVEALLDRPEVAMRHYREAVARQADIAAAVAALEWTKARHAWLHSPDFDPSGTTNSASEVRRVLEEAACSAEEVKRAEEAVTQAKQAFF
jgi:hypothetical protein